MTRPLAAADAFAAVVGEQAPLYSGAGIYHIGLLDTEQCYVGRSHRLANRIWDHITALAEGTHSNAKLQAAWNKHGAERFRVTVLQKVGGHAMVAAEQHWIDHHKAVTVGFNLAAFAGPSSSGPRLDPNDPGVIQHRYALTAIALALNVVKCAKMGSGQRVALKECLRWNAYALQALSKAPAELLQDGRGERRIREALRYANGRIRAAGDESLLRYIAAPETFPHNADDADLEEASRHYGSILGEAWERDNMRWQTEHATLAVGAEQVKLMRRQLQDVDFVHWCRAAITLADLPDGNGGIVRPTTWMTREMANQIVRSHTIKARLETPVDPEIIAKVKRDHRKQREADLAQYTPPPTGETT